MFLPSFLSYFLFVVFPGPAAKYRDLSGAFCPTALIYEPQLSTSYLFFYNVGAIRDELVDAPCPMYRVSLAFFKPSLI